jgi:hypothetical protein
VEEQGVGENLNYNHGLSRPYKVFESIDEKELSIEV